jgi:type I restriction enzyme R subunit
MSKQDLSEDDISAKFITPALIKAGWDEMSQIRRQVYFTAGRIIVRGKMAHRGKRKFADYILYYRPNLPLAIIEAKKNYRAVGDGMQQGLNNIAILDLSEVVLTKHETAEVWTTSLRAQLTTILAEALLR